MGQPTQVADIQAGGHACLTFSDPDERLDLLAVFVAAGLDEGQRVLCFTDAVAPDALTDELGQRGIEAADAVGRGQLRITDCASAWLGVDIGTAQHMGEVLRVQLRAAADDGYAGLRVSADMSWAVRPHTAAHELLRFERDVADGYRDGVADGRLTTLCEYDRGSFDPVTLAFAADVHSQAVAAQVYHEDPLLRICRQYRPAGIRAAGELDSGHLEQLRTALAETLRLDEHPHVNLRRVRYLDAACAAAIIQAAHELPAARTMHVSCGTLPATVLRLAGAVDVPGLRVRVTP
ncbi:MEDS domain-containing protein [Dactylosporangium vinaceum]|uniref:MEDS domain-containing protein n=1 Tax=Dactylosporangium vinaceum TaxID=53362 RepID=A0ABV5MKS2_9ACTN|nr:MEDS domain-containing protein [Dactylosporangium vinaceum]UAB93937.1 MEDS domain-containing protein [Dactylosporangium vinaceum]